MSVRFVIKTLYLFIKRSRSRPEPKPPLVVQYIYIIDLTQKSSRQYQGSKLVMCYEFYI